jgi:hypothetical protein
MEENEGEKISAKVEATALEAVVEEDNSSRESSTAVQ